MNTKGQLTVNKVWLSQRRQIFWWVSGGLSLLFLAMYYGSFAHFGYVSAPGGDLYNHTLYIQDLQQNGLKHFFNAYPRFFHLVVLIGMYLTSQPAIRVMLYLVPIVLLGVAWAAAFVSFQIAGEGGALVALFLSLFVSAQPTQTLYDGGFPNVISAHIWLPMLVGCLIIHERKRTWQWLLGALFFLFMMVITHAFTLTYGLIISLAAALYFGKRFYKFIGIFIASVVLFMLTPFSQPLRIMLNSFAHLTNQFPWVVIVGHLDNPNAMLPLGDYPRAISFLVFWLSLIGAGALLYGVFTKNRVNNYAAYLLFVWAGMLLLGSQAPFLGFPVRLARDLTAPMIIAGGIGVVWLWRGGGHTWWARPLLLAFCIALGYAHTLDRVGRLLTFEPAMQYTQADQMAVDAVGSAPAVTINQNLPSTVKPSIHWLVPTIVETSAKSGVYTLDQYSKNILGSSAYAFYENSKSTNGDIYRPYLEKEGFQEVHVFHDSLKDVVLYQRQ